METTPRHDLPITEVPLEWIGRELGARYRIEDRLGEGGIGVVFKALDRQTNTHVALKVLRENFAQTRLQRRFAREAKALAALRHPNIVSILDVDVADDTPFLVMELLEGETLGDLMLATRPLPVDRAVTIMRELIAALAYVHEQGLVHRDLKPGNVFLQHMPDGSARVKLLDFGLAKFLDGDAAIEQATVTRSGDIFGTLGYMPPEQAVGDTTDARADVYSAGAVFFEMLAGRRPFIGDGTDLLQRQLTAEPPSLMEACPERIASVELEAMLKRALANKASERFADATALLQAFDALPQPAVRAPTFEELEALSVAPLQEPPVPIGLAPTILHESVDTIRRVAAMGPVARFIENVKELGRGVLVAGAWVLSAIVTFLVLVAVAVIYILFGSEHDQQQQALREAMPSTIRKVLPDGSNAVADNAAATPTATKAAPVKSSAAATNVAATNVAATNVAATNVAAATAPEAPTDTPAVVEAAPVVDPSTALVASEGNDAGVGPTIEATSSRVPAQNPWRGSTPTTLKKLRTHAQKGWRGDERAISWLRRYNRETPDDPRGHLVLAMIFMNREWFSDAAGQYAFAIQRKPSSRGDTTMLRNLIKIASLPPTSERAAGLIVGIYGTEAIGAVDRAIAASRDPVVTGLLQQLRGRL